MAALIWTEPALQDLDAIADYIPLDKPEAAKELVRRVFQHLEQLREQPESGSGPPNCGVWGIGRSLSRLAGFSIASTAARFLFFT